MMNLPGAAAAAEAASEGEARGLEVPTPFAAADVIVHDKDGRLSFHYAIIEVSKNAALSQRMWEPKLYLAIKSMGTSDSIMPVGGRPTGGCTCSCQAWR